MVPRFGLAPCDDAQRIVIPAHSRGCHRAVRTGAGPSEGLEAAASLLRVWLLGTWAFGSFRDAPATCRPDSWPAGLCGSRAAGRRLTPEREAREMADMLVPEQMCTKQSASTPVAPHVQIRWGIAAERSRAVQGSSHCDT